MQMVDILLKYILWLFEAILKKSTRQTLQPTYQQFRKKSNHVYFLNSKKLSTLVPFFNQLFDEEFGGLCCKANTKKTHQSTYGASAVGVKKKLVGKAYACGSKEASILRTC